MSTKRPVESKGSRRKISKDWSKLGVVSDVFNQKSWNICWIVQTVKACESLYLIENPKERQELKLSIQEMVDCYWFRYPIPVNKDSEQDGWKIDKQGFRCGPIRGAMKYVKEHGVNLEEDWPTFKKVNSNGKPTRGQPREKVEGTTIFKIQDYKVSRGKDKWTDDQVVELLDKHPVAAGCYLTKAFRNLKKGEIYEFKEGTPKPQEKHAVLIVGYDIDEETQTRHYIIQNCWGTSWADGGYAKVKFGSLFGFCYPIGSSLNTRQMGDTPK